MDAIIEFFQDIFLTYSVWRFIGQLFGIAAIILGFVSYQMKTQRGLLFVQISVAVMFCIHYLLIGAYSGMAMNAVCIVRNLIYDVQARKGSKSKVIPIIFVIIQCAMCLLTWEAWYSVFVLLGIGINTYCMSFSNPQNVRKSIFITSPMVLTYDIFAGSVGGVIYESVVIISSFIGVLKNRRSNRK